MRLIFSTVAALAALLFQTMPAAAQCNSATGQCGNPAAALSARQQLVQLQLNNGAATSAASSAMAPALTPALGATTYYLSAPRYQAGPGYVYVTVPTVAYAPSAPAAEAPAPEDLVPPAPASPQQQPVQLLMPYGAYASIGAPGVLTAYQAGAASAAAAAAPAPLPVPLAVAAPAASSSACSSGSCGRVGLLRRIGARLRPARSSSRSVSVSRTR